jgi:hypothetical protein
MPLAPQDNSGEGNATRGNSAATFPLSPRNKGGKRRRASSGGQGNLPNARGPKVSGVIRRAKEKQGKMAGSWDANPSPPEPKSNRSPKEGRDRVAEPSMFAEIIVQHFDDIIQCSLKGEDDDETEVEGLKNAVQALKSRCDMLEKTVRDLQYTCETHQKSLETFRQHIVNLHAQRGTLDLSYEGEVFEATMS